MGNYRGLVYTIYNFLFLDRVHHKAFRSLIQMFSESPSVMNATYDLVFDEKTSVAPLAGNTTQIAMINALAPVNSEASLALLWKLYKNPRKYRQ